MCSRQKRSKQKKADRPHKQRALATLWHRTSRGMVFKSSFLATQRGGIFGLPPAFLISSLGRTGLHCLSPTARLMPYTSSSLLLLLPRTQNFLTEFLFGRNLSNSYGMSLHPQQPSGIRKRLRKEERGITSAEFLE